MLNLKLLKNANFFISLASLVEIVFEKKPRLQSLSQTVGKDQRSFVGDYILGKEIYTNV